MDMLTLLILLTGATLALNLLGVLTAYADGYLKKIRQETPEESLPPIDDSSDQQLQDSPVPEEETANFWWGQLFSAKGMFGLLASPLQIPILLVNSSLISTTFEVILDRAGQPLFWINLWGWDREVMNYDLYGVLISLSQMASASAYHLATKQEEEKLTLVKAAAAVALLSLVLFEVSASVYRAVKEVHLLTIDTDPEKGVKVIHISERNIGTDKEIASIFDYIQTYITQPPRYKGTTNIGGVLAYAERISQTFEETRKSAKARGKPLPPPSRFVVNVFTDGKLEGTQTKWDGGAWPKEVRVWFWGVKRPYLGSLRKWVREEVGLPEEQLTIVPFSDWQAMANKIFGQSIDRPWQDPEILKRLHVSDPTAHR